MKHLQIFMEIHLENLSMKIGCEMKKMGVTCVIIDVWLLLLFCACMICHSGLLLPRCLGVCALQGPWRAVSREPKVAFCADSEEIWNVERAGQGVSQDSCSPERPRVEACALSMRRVGKERATEGGRHARRREFGGRPRSAARDRASPSSSEVLALRGRGITAD